MTSIPQELIDTIIHEVEDADSLKACTLTASSLRDTSQRILFNSLTLMLPGQYSVWSTRLAESPHVAEYIRTLRLRISSRHSQGFETQSLALVLGKLMNVRRCTIAGDGDLAFRNWDQLGPFAQVAIDFVRRQTLAELHLVFFNGLPLSVLALLVSCAPRVSFSHTEIGPFLMDSPSDPTPCLEQLLLAQKTSSISLALQAPECSPYLTKLRRLGLRPDGQYNGILVSVGPTLEHVRFDCTSRSSNSVLLPLPRLPVLRSVDLVILFGARHEAWLLDGLLDILRSCPDTLDEICVTYYTIDREILPPYVLQPATLATLDQTMANCTVSPRLRWRLDFDLDHDGEHLAAFTMFVQQGLPRVHERNKLMVEGFSFTEELREWSIR
ncbi:hypothetical protein DFH07DRAFT_936925 [Mycena maculata]|uniref:F-box domain-containing protein n=1 Tax=Mycena maculata TaxID=230809 RepID=A0AAD7K0N9_9AGAR|nr:hypothetical protein DFH07DRAFT_936925 [Mycena maculata]